MQLTRDYILRRGLYYSLMTFATVSPLFFILLGTYFITEQSFHIIMHKVGGADLFPEIRPFNPISTIIGVLSFILAIVLPVYVIKKGHAGFGWFLSLTVNTIFLFIFFIFITTPLLDFLVMNIIFRKGFCNFLDRSNTYQRANISNASDLESLEKSSQITNEFCTTASRGFMFSYP